MSTCFRAAVIVFPGSNCDRDAMYALERAKVTETDSCLYHWHERPVLRAEYDIAVLPGGFSFGDHLRTGALAAKSIAVQSLQKFAEDGGYVLGVCNGFQILCEAGLLPGALTVNEGLKFVCKDVEIDVVDGTTALTAYSPESIKLPVAHHSGRYVGSPREEGATVVFKYSDNPNGSVNDVAGIMDESGRIFGMMPHPERNVDKQHGSGDGEALFEALVGAALYGGPQC